MLDLVRGGLGRAAILASVVSLSLSPLAAITAPPAQGKAKLGRMVDARVNLPDSYKRAQTARPGVSEASLSEVRQTAAATKAAIAQLKRTMPGLEVKLSPVTGGPEWVRNRRGALTAAAPGHSSERVVRDFLSKNGGLYGLTADDVEDLVRAHPGSVVIVSHSLGNLQRDCDVGVYVRRGSVSYFDKVEDAIAAYKEDNKDS